MKDETGKDGGERESERGEGAAPEKGAATSENIKRAEKIGMEVGRGEGRTS